MDQAGRVAPFLQDGKSVLALRVGEQLQEAWSEVCSIKTALVTMWIGWRGLGGRGKN